jgi:uncharacterized membrane protein YozB (DUF420 family)
MSILGTKAPVIYDLNLILQIVIMVILFAGAYYAKRKMKFELHGRVMALALLLNAISTIFVMAPRLFETLSYLASTLVQVPTELALVHPILGGLAEILGFIVLASLRPCGLKMGRKIRYLMRATFVIWTLAFLFGLSVYIAFYVF